MLLLVKIAVSAKVFLQVLSNQLNCRACPCRDNVLIGANAVVIEGVQIGSSSVVAARIAIVLKMFQKTLW